MTLPPSISQDLTDGERRECTLRNLVFVTALRDFRKRWPSPPSFPPPQVGLRIEAVKQFQAQGRTYLAELIRFWNRWPSITPNDVIGGASTPPGPKVQLAPYSPVTWPRDGSLLLCIHPTATGDEVKQAWRKIKRELIPTKRRLRYGERRLKLRIYDFYYRDGKMFRQIAKQTGKSVSAVFNLLVSACTDIGHVRDPKQKRMDPGWDHQKHFSGCPECQTGRLCRLEEEKAGVKMPSYRRSFIPDPSYSSEDSEDN